MKKQLKNIISIIILIIIKAIVIIKNWYKKLPINVKDDFNRTFLMVIIFLICFQQVRHYDYYTITPIEKATFKLYLFMMQLIVTYVIRKFVAPYVKTADARKNVENATDPQSKIAWAIVYRSDTQYYIGLNIAGAIIIAFGF